MFKEKIKARQTINTKEREKTLTESRVSSNASFDSCVNCLHCLHMVNPLNTKSISYDCAMMGFEDIQNPLEKASVCNYFQQTEYIIEK